MELQSADLTWPPKVKRLNSGEDKKGNPTKRVVFEYINGTISRTFEKYGYGIAFSEDNASKIWNLKGSWNTDIGGFNPYTGEKFLQGDYVSVQLKHEIYIDKNGQEKENFLVQTYKGDDGNETWAIKKSDAPAPVSQPTPTQTPAPVRQVSDSYSTGAKKGMTLNCRVELVCSGKIAEHFGKEAEKKLLVDCMYWLDKAEQGLEIYTDEHPLQDIAGIDDLDDSPSVAKAKELGGVEVSNDTVEQETFNWDNHSKS